MFKNLKSSTPSVSTLIWLSFFVLTLAWGSSFILVKRGLEAYSSWQVASLRIVSAFAALGVFGAMALRHIPVRKLPIIFVSSMLSMFVPAYLFSAAQIGVSSSVAGVLNALTPVFTFIMGIVFFRQPSKWLQIVGLSLGFVGSALLILRGKQGEFALNGYAFCVVAATVCYGLNVNLVKKYLFDVKPLHYSAVAVSMGGILAAMHFFSTNWHEIYQTAPKGKSAFWAIVTLGVMGTAFSQLIFNMMLQYATAVFASSITYFIPIVAVMWGVWDGEILTLWHFLGMACIIGGILIINKAK
jgi:drug/metabolite transporter (DMT)-like permease